MYKLLLMKEKKSREFVNRSVRLPSDLWDKIRLISSRNYRSLNSQFLKIVEDWMDDRDYLGDGKRTRLDD